MGDFFSQTRMQRGLGRTPQNFSDPGGGPAALPPCRARRCMHTHSPTPGRAGVAFRGGAPSKLAPFPPAFRLFPGGLLVMVELAQALVIGRTDKQVPVSTEGDNMVHHRGRGAPPLGRTDPAERFPQQLCRAQFLGPDGLGIPAVIGPAGPSPVLSGGGPMLGAPPVPSQFRASWMPGRVLGFASPWAVTSWRYAKQKTPEPVTTCKGVITGSGVLRSGLSKY